jgi:hypothetical protein
VLAVEGRTGMCGDIDGPLHPPVGRIEGIQRVAGGNPDVPAIEGDSMHVVDAWKRSILTQDLGG